MAAAGTNATGGTLIQFVAQTSTDLVTWTNFSIGEVVNTSGSVSYTPTGPDKSFVRLAVNSN